MKVLTIIPAYNERGNIKPLTLKLRKSFSKMRIPFEILFIIQGNDGSKEEVEEMTKLNYPVRYFYSLKPLGIGRAYKIGFKAVNTSFTHVLTLDADLNHDPAELPKFFTRASSFDFIIGSRFIRGGGFRDRRGWKRLSSRMVNCFIRRLFSLPVHDLSYGFRLIKSEAVITLLPHLIETGYPSYVELLLLASKQPFRLTEVPIHYIPRIWGKSKMNVLRTGLDYFIFFMRLFRFFSQPIPAAPR